MSTTKAFVRKTSLQKTYLGLSLGFVTNVPRISGLCVYLTNMTGRIKLTYLPS